MRFPLVLASFVLFLAARRAFAETVIDPETGEETDVETEAFDLGAWLDMGQPIDASLLGLATVQAFLQTIRAGEGTSGPEGYRTLFGGGLFESYADHPRQVICRTVAGKRLCSSAAGAYQFLRDTWDRIARKLALQDFSPSSQDLAALQLIAEKGALDDVIAGRFEIAVSKVRRVWASMPGAGYGQPEIALARYKEIYLAALRQRGVYV